MTEKFVADEKIAGKTLRQYFAENGFSQTLVKHIKFDGRLVVNGEPKTVAYTLQKGDIVEYSTSYRLKTPQFASQAAEVLFADKYLYVANKPYGVATHPDRTHRTDTLGNALAAYFGEDFELRTVTRLDKTTSGLVLGALNARTAKLLNDMQQNREINKTYQAEAEGSLAEKNGRIVLPLSRVDRLGKTIVDANGKAAETEFVFHKQKEQTTLLTVIPRTGRTHQIRCHLAAIGNPICGDTLYGAKSENRVKLHCAKLSFIHPITKEKVEVSKDADFWEN